MPFWGHHNVVWLDVAVHDSLRMRFGERIRQLHGDVEGTAHVQRATADNPGQQLAGNVLEHDVQVRRLLADFKQRGNVRVGKHRRGPCFLQESLAAFRIGGDTPGEYLDDDGAAENGATRPEHVTHPARAELAKDLVVAERVNYLRRSSYTRLSAVSSRLHVRIRLNKTDN